MLSYLDEDIHKQEKFRRNRWLISKHDVDIYKGGAEMVCKNCGRKYTAPPATSRNGLGDICPVCGAEESLAGFPEEMKEEVVRKIEEQEIAWGRVEKRVEALA